MAGLVLELQKDAMDSSINLSDLLRKALVVAKKLDVRELQEWAKCELYGYKDINETPAYREVVGVIKGYDPNIGWTPAVIMDEKIANTLRKRKVRESIGNLESLVQKQSKDGYLLVKFAPGIEKILMESGSYEAIPGLFVGVNAVEGIFDTIRNMVLEWALKLEEEGILGEGLSFSPKEKEKAQSNPNISIQHFQGILGNVAYSSITQDFKMSIQTNDFKSLADFLKSHSVSKEDISELENAIQDDPKPISSDKLGEKVGGWIGNMISKAATGAWDIGVQVARTILTKAISMYYGLPS